MLRPHGAKTKPFGERTNTVRASGEDPKIADIDGTSEKRRRILQPAKESRSISEAH